VRGAGWRGAAGRAAGAYMAVGGTGPALLCAHIHTRTGSQRRMNRARAVVRPGLCRAVVKGLPRASEWTRTRRRVMIATVQLPFVGIGSHTPASGTRAPIS
jgi:hypothetical protein